MPQVNSRKGAKHSGRHPICSWRSDFAAINREKYWFCGERIRMLSGMQNCFQHW